MLRINDPLERTAPAHDDDPLAPVAPPGASAPPERVWIESEHLLHTLVGNSSDLIAVLDDHGQLPMPTPRRDGSSATPRRTRCRATSSP